MSARFLLALGVLAVLAGCAGQPAGCAAEKVAELPVRLIHRVPVVPVQINGQAATLVVDTGSDRTVLTRAAARRLGVAEAAGTVRVGGAGGLTTVGQGRVERLGLNGAVVGPLDVLLADAPGPPLDGVLGIDVLVGFELELDVPHGRAALYRARSCATAAPDWAGPYERLAVQQQARSGHLFVPVEVAGQPLRGMLDTGASDTVLSVQSAEDIGLGPRALARLQAYRGSAINAEGIVSRMGLAATVRVGRTVMERLPLVVTDLPVFAGDLLVGEDYLGRRKVWVSFGLGRVFVAP